jgi:hypothetical protein
VVHIVWFTHWLPIQLCTQPLAHCVPDVHATQAPFKQTGVVPEHGAWLTHWLLTQVCGVLPAAHWAPDVHATQLRLTQKGVTPMQDVPHAPQLPTSVLSFTQTLLQTTSPPMLHVWTQLVPLQLTLPPLGAVHGVHVAPHALLSLATHAPAHKCVPPVHWHEPVTQCSPPRHLLPHALQLLSSLVSSTHAPPQSV